MRYYKIEEINKRPTNPEAVHERRERTGAIDVGTPESVSSIYLATDPNTDKVHHELMVESTPAETQYFDFNQTANDPRYKKDEQLPLFHSRETPGKFHIEAAFGTERGRTHSILMAATAKARGEEIVGPTEVQPSVDLSSHSLPLVKNLQKRGLIGSDEDYEYPDNPTNYLDFSDPSSLHSLLDYVDSDPEEIQAVPKSELSKGKEELKRFLGRLPKPQPPVNTNQFPQSSPTLFDQ